MYKRREFLKTAAAGIALTAITGNLAGCKTSSSFSSGNIKDFGLQLYTLRDILPKDPKGILKQVSEMGYKQVESYNHKDLGIFWGMTNIEFKKYLDDIGLTIVSTHYKPDNNFERIAAEAAAIGIKFLIYPYEGSPLKKQDPEYATLPKTINEFKKMADEFNRYGEVCRKHGIRFGYHNHDYTFSSVENEIPESTLLDNTDKDLVDFEMDIYWVVTAGQDPIKWFKQYPDRFRLCHIKDRKKGVPLSEREVSVTLGTGSIDFENILKTARKNGLQYYIVEQERYDNTTPIQASKEDAEYLKKLKI